MTTKADELWTGLSDDEKKMLRSAAKRNTGEEPSDEQMLLKLREASDEELAQFRMIIEVMRKQPSIKQVIQSYAEGKSEKQILDDLSAIELPPSALELSQSRPPPVAPPQEQTEAATPAPTAEAIGKAGANALMQDPSVKKLMGAVQELIGDS